MLSNTQIFERILQHSESLNGNQVKCEIISKQPSLCTESDTVIEWLPKDIGKLDELLRVCGYTFWGRQLDIIVKFLIGAGANLPRFHLDNIDGIIFANIELLLNRSINSLSPTVLLQQVADYSLILESKGASITPAAESAMTYLLNAGAELPVRVNPSFKMQLVSANAELLLNRTNNSISATNLLRMVTELIRDGAQSNQEDYLINFAYEKGADFHAQLDPEDEGDLSLSIFERLFTHNKLDALHKLSGTNIRSIIWLIAITETPSVTFVARAIEQFGDSFLADEVFDFGRARGASISTVHMYMDIYYLAKDYLQSTKNLSSGVLNAIEISLLSSAPLPLPIEEYKHIELLNRYGFSPLQLALLGLNFPLAEKMIIAGLDLTRPNANGTTAAVLLSLSLNSDGDVLPTLASLTHTALSKIKDVDVDLGCGETLADIIVGMTNFTNITLSLTTDPLFEFLKPDANLTSLNTDKVNIAVSHGDSLWSTGIWSWARQARAPDKDINFHLVDLETLHRGGDKFISQFDGWINPGGGDDYPRDREFDLSNWQSEMRLIQTYQHVLNRTSNFSIPSLGICAGAQNLALYSGGSIYNLPGYSHGAHVIHFLEGTMSHFMAMNRDQQKAALKHCDFSSITIKGDTAHRFAASSYNLGSLELGAISAAHGVAMAYSDKLSFATQFHPEHHWAFINESSHNHEREWLNNFILLSRLHHESRDGHAPHPGQITEAIQSRLHECMQSPTSIAEDQPMLGDQKLSDAFFS